MERAEKQDPRWWPLLLLTILIGIVFSPSLGNGFLHYDDSVYLTENPLVRSLSPTNIGRIFTTIQPHAIYVPLVTLSYALEYKIWKLNPFGYHLTNLILHIVNAFLVFILISQLFSHYGVAFFTSLLFALHPLRVESVAWVTERKDLLFALFMLLALLHYLGHLKKNSSVRYLLALGFFIAAILAKTTALVLPFLLILLDGVVERRISSRRWLEKIPFLLVMILLILITAAYSGDFTPQRSYHNYTAIAQNLLGAVPFYMLRTIWPAGLAIRYPTDMRFFMPPLWLSLLLSLFLVSGSFFLFRRYRREWAWGWSFFLISLLPVFGLIWLHYPVADRYSYFPAIGLSFIFVSIPAIGLDRTGNRRSLLKPILVGAGMVALAFLAVATFQRCRVWKNNLSLWNDVIRKYPMTPLALHNRGNAFTSLGRFDEAIRDYSESIRLLPDRAESYWNRALAWSEKNNPGRAETDFSTAIRIDPVYFRQYYRLQVALAGAEGLIATLDMGDRLAGTVQNAEIHATMAEVCVRMKKWTEAEDHLLKAIALEPESAVHRHSLRVLQHQLRNQ